MKITCFGHAAVGVTLPGCAILFDPFESGSFGGKLSYPPIQFQPDLILVSHDHADHAYTKPFPEVEVIGPAQFSASTKPLQWRNIEIKPLRVAHDPFDGRTRGGHSWMLHLTLHDGTGIVHSGDIGELPSQDDIDDWLAGSPVDLCFIACGGYYTLGGAEAAELTRRLNTKVTVPFHHKTHGCNLPNISSAKSMISRFARVKHNYRPTLELTQAMLRATKFDVLVML